MSIGRKPAGAIVAFVATMTVGAVMVALPGAAGAGPAPLALIVNATEDNHGFDDADGLCDDGPGGTCSLREAVAVAENNGPAGAAITFGVDGTFVLDGDIAMNGTDVSITGNGIDKTVISAANGGNRHFRVGDGELTLGNMTLRDGYAEVGGSVLLQWRGALTTMDTHFVENYANAGGAIYADANNDTLDVRETTFVGNEAEAGGAIYVNYDTATVSNSTFTANTALSGAAIYVTQPGTLSVHWSTLSGNILGEPDLPVRPAAADSNGRSFQSFRSSARMPAGFSQAEQGVIGGRDDQEESADITISHSILEKTTGDDTDECSGGTFISGGANIVDDDSCGFSEALDVEGVAANVGALGDNGGPTFTMALTVASAAVDVDPALCKLNDQRDLPRNVDGDEDGTDACDSGAYELQVTPVDPTTSTTTTAPDGDVDADTATPATPTVAQPTFTG